MVDHGGNTSSLHKKLLTRATSDKLFTGEDPQDVRVFVKVVQEPHPRLLHSVAVAVRRMRLL